MNEGTINYIINGPQVLGPVAQQILDTLSLTFGLTSWTRISISNHQFDYFLK